MPRHPHLIGHMPNAQTLYVISMWVHFHSIRRFLETKVISL